MSWINFFGLIEGLDIVKFSEYLDKYVEWGDGLFNLLGHHQVIVVHESLPQVRVVSPRSALVLVGRVNQAPSHLRTLHSSHSILI